MKRLRQLLVALLAAAVATGAAGCARVKPWQREHHSRRAMQPQSDPGEAKLDAHVTEYREGSIGGVGVGGGGCGCN